MITIIKFFIVIIFISSAVVWLTNNPGIVTFLWNNYLIETNSLGLIFVVLSILIAIIFFLSLFKSFKKKYMFKELVNNKREYGLNS